MTYNIREKFSYVIATTNIDYIRNYNFNSATVTDIPIILSNSDDSTPITVNMTTSVPWMQLIDPADGRNIKFPNGNVVLIPTSSKNILLKIDLPPEIEIVSASVIYPSITFDIRSGSALIQSPPEPLTPPNNPTGTINAVDEITLNVGQRQLVNIRVYDKDGNLQDGGSIDWKVQNMSIAQLEYAGTEIDNLSSRDVIGISPGTTLITYTDNYNNNRAFTRVVVNSVVDPGSKNGACGIACKSDADCSGNCAYCNNGICSQVPEQNSGGQ